MAVNRLTLARWTVLGALLVAGVLLLGILPLAATVTLFRTGLAPPQREIVVELPADYRGWVVISYFEPTCPPLSRRGRQGLITVSASGRACTSSPRELDGNTRSHYELVHPDGARSDPNPKGEAGIWGSAFTVGLGPNPPVVREAFFVGTEAAYQANQQGN